jgi:hypothetical protein
LSVLGTDLTVFNIICLNVLIPRFNRFATDL